MADSTNIVRIEEISECVNRTIQGIRDGVSEAMKSGITASLPEKVDFTMIVVKDWQILDHSSTDSSMTTEKQGGFSAETLKSTASDNQSAKETRGSTSEDSHVQNDGRTVTTYETS